MAMKMKKKLLSLFTILCMVVALLPALAFAESSSAVTFYALDGTGTGSEGYDKLIDGKKTEDNGSKWCVDLPEGGAYIIIKASEPIKVNGYTFTTGNDNATSSGRNPKTWKLYGSNDYDESSKSGTWTAISTIAEDNTMQDKNYTPYSFSVSGEDAWYRHYKLDITAVQSGTLMQLGEMEFSYTTCEHSWTVTGSTEADCMNPKYETKNCSGDCRQTITVPVGSPLGHINDGSNHCTFCGKLFIQQVGGFTVSNAIKDEDYTYENNELKILTANPITIRNTDPDTATTTERIVVAKDVSANVTLAGVNIDVSATDNACAFKIEDDSGQDVTLILLEGTKNILKSGKDCAGLQKNGYGDGIGTLYIKGSGTLEATGKGRGAGIGGGSKRVQNIEILSGNIIAQGGSYSAGIGGCSSAAVTDITISGGNIWAKGGEEGAGIGGGTSGNVFRITITGGVVYAEGGSGAAGIGAGFKDQTISPSKFIISGGTVTAKSGGNSADDIGNDGSGFGGSATVVITGGSVKADSVTDAKNSLGGDSKSVYPLTIENPKGTPVYIDGTEYKPVNHTAMDSNDTNLYIYLTEKTAAGEKHTVQVNGMRSEISMVNGAFSIGSWTDIEKPAISGLEAGKVYYGDVSFYVTDNDGIAGVKAGEETLTAEADGKYTLKAGIGEVKVVVTDNQGNTAEITVTVNYGGGNAIHTNPTMNADGTEEPIEESCQHPNLEYIEAKAATDTEEGNIEYWYCADCDKYFSDKDGENEIAKADTVIEKLSNNDAEYATDVEDESDKEIPPKTGDNESLALWLTMAAASVVGAVVLKRKKKIRIE